MSLLDIVKDPANRVPSGIDGASGIVDCPEPDTVILPLEYPGQILFNPLVQAGEIVARNQAIGRSERGNYVHASISGKVREIRTVWSARSFHVPAVVIDREPIDALEPAEAMGRCGLDFRHASRVDLLRAGGVVSPWSTPGKDHREVDVTDYPSIRHILIKGFNEEPTITNFERLLLENVEGVRESIQRLGDLVPQAQIWLTVRRSLVGWAEEQFGDAAEIAGVSEAYRHRLERLVVPRVTGIQVPYNKAFRSRGIAVLSVEHALNALAALVGRPVTHKTVTIAGAGIEQPLTVRTPLGTTVGDILASQGLEIGDYDRVIMGGPMMGMTIFDAETPLSKFQHGIYLLRRDDLPTDRNLTCVNCGRCARSCPANLQVHLVGLCVEYDRLDAAAAYHPEVCFECGLCAYVCPSHRPLVQLMRMAKRYGENES